MADLPIPQQDPGIYQKMASVLGLPGSTPAVDANVGGSQNFAPSFTPTAPAVPSFAPSGTFSPQDVQQAQAAQEKPESGLGGILGGEMTEAKKQRMMLFAAAMMSGGSLVDKLQLAALSQSAYTELQGAQARETAQKQAEMERQRLDSENLRTQRTASTESTLEATSQSKEMRPANVRKASAEADKVEAESEKISAEADIKALEAAESRLLIAARNKLDPTGAERAKLALEDVRAALALKKSQSRAADANAGHAAASAAHLTEQTAGESQKNMARLTLTNSDATPDQHAAALEVLSGGRSALNAKKDEHTMIKKLYKEANPGATEQEQAAYALEYGTTAKGQLLRAAQAIIAQGDTKSPEYKDAVKLVQSDIKAGIASREKGVKSGTSTTEGGKTMTEADVQSNMTKYKKTREEVLAEATRQGYTVK